MYTVRRLYYPAWFGSVGAAPEYGPQMTDETIANRLRVPPGFKIGLYAGASAARLLRFTSTGDLLVSQTNIGKVSLLEHDANGDGKADGSKTLFDNLSAPHGMVLHDGWLYIAEGNAIFRVRFDADKRTVDGKPEYIVRDVPVGGHGTRTIGIGPDGWLYLSIGSSCNVCIEDNPRRAAITRFHLDGSGEERYATGLRNSVGFTWQPGSGAMYATDNGRDWLGDDFPPCELNRIVQGGFYGWPFANGNRVPDPDFGNEHAEDIAVSIPPAHAFGAHVAPLGLTFYDAQAFPEKYRGAIFVAQHGSWNRSKKSGYKVVAVFLHSDGSTQEEDFLTGFERDDNVVGRPVDVAVGPDGALYVSDDYSGSVYRIAYTG
ncbi:MAG: sorbosone dehydrogenase family protein [Deltaproteobacteria bacterium]|nr:sorbosone dehydrogenase family protein [Deltaproteobacteria bacterium]